VTCRDVTQQGIWALVIIAAQLMLFLTNYDLYERLTIPVLPRLEVSIAIVSGTYKVAPKSKPLPNDKIVLDGVKAFE